MNNESVKVLTETETRDPEIFVDEAPRSRSLGRIGVALLRHFEKYPDLVSADYTKRTLQKDDL